MSIAYELNGFRERLRGEKQLCSYDALVERYQVNKYYLWHIVTDDNYQPPIKIASILGVVLPTVVISIDGPIHPGAQCPGSKQCPIDARWFVPNTPRRKKCYTCSPRRIKNGNNSRVQWNLARKRTIKKNVRYAEKLLLPINLIVSFVIPWLVKRNTVLLPNIKNRSSY